jgi:uncharacterized protein YfkK (UPF0435 family)
MSNKEKEDNLKVEDILKIAKDSVSKSDMDYVYTYLYSIMDKFSESELAAIATALEQIDENFYENEEDDE